MSDPRVRLSAPQAAVLRSVRDWGVIPVSARQVTVQALRRMRLITRVNRRLTLAHVTARGERVLERWEIRHNLVVRQ